MFPTSINAQFKLDRVMVCWDGSRPAARAIADAMPLLERAGTIEVVIIANERGKQNQIKGADMGQHFARRGLKVKVNRVMRNNLDVANVLLSHSADFDANFIVMGGYGHSRLREFVLGGVTRTILHSMTVPVLMSLGTAQCEFASLRSEAPASVAYDRRRIIRISDKSGTHSSINNLGLTGQRRAVSPLQQVFHHCRTCRLFYKRLKKPASSPLTEGLVALF